jgi:transketolase
VEAHKTLKAAGIEAMVLGVSCPKEIAKEDLARAAKTGLIVTVEDHNVNTGLGARVAVALMEYGLQKNVKLIRLGATHYGDSGTPEALYAAFSIDSAGIAATVKKALGKA